MDSRKDMLIKIILDDLPKPDLNDLLMKLQFRCAPYGFLEDMVKGMHLPLNKIHDTTQFNI